MGINRRQFLISGATAVAGATIGSGAAKGTSSNVFFTRSAAKKVLILGAGMAGLVAGYELSQLGHEVTILEARNRPGGRVHTLREPFSEGLYAEAGAARIPDHHDLTLKYVKLFDLPLEPMYPSTLSALRLDGGSRREVSHSAFTEGLGHFFGFDLGRSAEQYSKIKGGMDVLPYAFAKKLGDKIRYGAVVVRVEQDATAARAVFIEKGNRQTLTADRILSAIPFSVLRTIELPNDLSERKRQVIKRTPYDAVSRVYLQMKMRAWEQKGLSGFALTDRAIEVWHPTWNQRGTKGILMTYARPGEAERIGQLPEAERISSTVTLLDGLFSGVRENFELGTSKYWPDDEWARGAWGFVGFRDLVSAQSPEGRIHFAGEHLSTTFSWIQGALWSGLQAVKQIDEAPVTTALAA